MSNIQIQSGKLAENRALACPRLSNDKVQLRVAQTVKYNAISSRFSCKGVEWENGLGLEEVNELLGYHAPCFGNKTAGLVEPLSCPIARLLRLPLFFIMGIEVEKRL